MSALKGIVGSKKVHWKKAPTGASGSGEVSVNGKSYSVSWKRDRDGLWLETENGIFGFDIVGQLDEESGMTYRISERGADRLLSALKFVGEGESEAGASQSGKKKAVRVRAQMPGKIVRVLVKSGEAVVKDQPLLVMEAMKMENEIRSPAASVVSAVKVVEGQAVESGADLILLS